MSVKKTKVVGSLQRKGFVHESKKNPDHEYYHYYTSKGEETTVFTYCSHGRGDIENHILRLMAKQMRITYRELLEFVDCKLSKEKYEQHLKANDHL